ncbi:MAG TPA: urease accessory UreF family protein [Acidocella sp.]|jgi:urease accessory protein|uniref:urease accessory protein UreF n=1 Tax=Acidocella sp. TaxID=50710 RepID=UPI002C8A5C5B|nr:urease accessory UreF family protein [Acidocella sp.]HVE20477.1 urease accessory UreF family protein [Acidocella sp.]
MADLPLLRLLTWLSPAFPTGGFAYSHGLEWAVEAGHVHDEASLSAWMDDTLRLGALWSDVILLRLAHRGEDVAALGMALCATAERRLESSAQGAAFALAAAPWPGPDWNEEPLPYAVAVGQLAAAHGVAEDDTALAFLHAASANMVSAAIRLIPLGQTAGLRVQAALEPTLLDVAQASATSGPDDLGGACWVSDIAAMRHETQYTRLFRS